jgi:RNA polymerase sigma-70 factor (ECF subfamily)
MPDLRPGVGRTPAPGDPEARGDLGFMDRMRLGDETALESLYARHGGLIYALALRIVGDPGVAREVLQDTFLRCWDKREAYDEARGRVLSWLVSIARHRAIDLLRSRPHQARLREREPLAELMPEAAPPDAADTLALRRVIASALGALPAAQRQAIEMAYFGGQTQAEIASALAQPLGTIKSRTREAMERLRATLWPLIKPEREAQKDRG